MKEFIIQTNEAGQRLDKYLKKRLPNASSAFLYKMLRKKNITLNGKKALGKEGLIQNDVIRMFFSDETYAKFSADSGELLLEYETLKELPMKGIKILFEDEHIIACYKPANMLSQKASPRDLSANEYLIGYLIRKGELSFSEFLTFRPSVCNRLDRNTTGILLAGKSLHGLQKLSADLKDRNMKKYYHTIVAGQVTKPQHLEGYLWKNEKNNQVEISKTKNHPQAQWIETSYKPLKMNDLCTLLEVHLITGRSHQIRGHLASINHPVIGDLKYGNPKVNQVFKEKYHVQHQLLHASRVEFPDQSVIVAPDPDIFSLIL